MAALLVAQPHEHRPFRACHGDRSLMEGDVTGVVLCL
jgi:hypothetical protein